MRVFIFECNDETQGTCFEKQLFGSNSLWPLQVNKDDYCLLFNYQRNIIFGLWKAESKGKKNIDQHAWFGKFPFQVKVMLCSKKYISFSKSKALKFICDDNGRVRNEIFGNPAQDLLQYLAREYHGKIEIGEELDKFEKDYRREYAKNWHCSDGHDVRSLSEMAIDEWLHKNHIDHAYEELINIPEKLYPDFVVYGPEKRPVYIEFWGKPDDPHYLCVFRRIPATDSD